MADDWRVTIDFDDEGDGTQFAEWLAAVDLEGEERTTLGDRVIVSRDGPRVYLYADSEEPAREVSARFRRGSSTRAIRPSPRSSAGIRSSRSGRTAPSRCPDTAGGARGGARAVSGARGCRVGRDRAPPSGRSASSCGTHEDTVALAERLESEGIPVVRRHTFLLAGAANEDDARALAERLRGEAPEGAKVEVEPGGGMVWEVAPRNPFTFFGGLGG